MKRLASLGDNIKNFSLKADYFSALIFLPAEEIPGYFNELKLHLPKEASKTTNWFKNNYVCNRLRRHWRNGGVAVQSPVPFLPNLWCVYESMWNGFPRTKTDMGAWHRRWENLIENAHGSVYQIIDKLKKNQCCIENKCGCILWEQSHIKSKEASYHCNTRLQNRVI